MLVCNLTATTFTIKIGSQNGNYLWFNLIDHYYYLVRSVLTECSIFVTLWQTKQSLINIYKSLKCSFKFIWSLWDWCISPCIFLLKFLINSLEATEWLLSALIASFCVFFLLPLERNSAVITAHLARWEWVWTHWYYSKEWVTL